MCTVGNYVCESKDRIIIIVISFASFTAVLTIDLDILLLIYNHGSH
jgi:hypothetical protein